MKMRTLERWVQAPNDLQLQVVDFADDLARGELLESVKIEVDTLAGEDKQVSISNKNNNGRCVSFGLRGKVPYCLHAIRVIARTTMGAIKVRAAKFEVE